MSEETLSFHDDCLFFSGEKPCAPYKVCWDCRDYKKIEESILYIHTGALGDIVRQMAILREILERRPAALVTVATSDEGAKLFASLAREYAPRMKVLSLASCSPFYWQVVEFDEVYNLDRTLESSALATMIKARKKSGFKLLKNGRIGIFNPEARLIYRNGLDDQEKFHKNKLFADQLMAESLGIVAEGKDFQREYGLKFPPEVHQRMAELRQSLRARGPQSAPFELIIGLNLGVGKTLPTKRPSLGVLAGLIKHIHARKSSVKFLLLGGNPDKHLALQLKQMLFPSRGDEGPRDQVPRESVEELIVDDPLKGAEIIGALDCLITGDTLALHLAMSLSIPGLAWFGPTHPEEIRMQKNSTWVRWSESCSPCWRPRCPQEEKCYESERTLQGLCRMMDAFLEKGAFPPPQI